MAKLILSSFIILTAQLVLAQKIKKDEVDKFLGTHIIETSWEPIFKEDKLGGSKWWNVRIRKIDELMILDCKFIMNSSVFSVNEKSPLMILFTNGDKVELYPDKFEVTCEGCGATGNTYSGVPRLHVGYKLTDTQQKSLNLLAVEAFRLYTADGYYEGEVKSANASNISALINLVNKK
ncbi:MAG: hypothetical protein R2813_05395 [Flavobacteriales bacterium]